MTVFSAGQNPPATAPREVDGVVLDTVERAISDIAARLSLAEKTVRNQVSRIYKKLRVRNRAQATVSWLGRH